MMTCVNSSQVRYNFQMLKMRQFSLIVSISLRYGTTGHPLNHLKKDDEDSDEDSDEASTDVSIPLRYGTTLFSEKPHHICAFMWSLLCQFLLGTVQRLLSIRKRIERHRNCVNSSQVRYNLNQKQLQNCVSLQQMCQFLLGTVQRRILIWQVMSIYVSIPLRYGTTAVFSCYH